MKYVNKKRILLITPSLEFPGFRGYEVMLWKYLKEASIYYDIDLVTFYKKEDEKAKTYKYAKPFCVNIHFIKLSKFKLLINIFYGFLIYLPFQVLYYRSNKMSSLIKKLVAENSYSILFFNLIRTAQFIPNNYTGKSVLNMVDPLVLNYEKTLKLRNIFYKTVFCIEIRRLKSYEYRILNNFSHISLISKKDIEDYENLYGINTFINLPYGVDINYFSPLNKTFNFNISDYIIITGNMSYWPNVKGVIFFCEKVFPLIKLIYPDIKLFLVGANPTKKIVKFGIIDKQIVVTGKVEDIRYYLGNAKVSICPISLDVGVQTKVLESMAMGTPVVTTSAGSRGIIGKNKKHFLIADTPEDIADSVIAILNGEYKDRMINSARNFVINNFSWDYSVSIFLKLISSTS